MSVKRTTRNDSKTDAQRPHSTESMLSQNFLDELDKRLSKNEETLCKRIVNLEETVSKNKENLSLEIKNINDELSKSVKYALDTAIEAKEMIAENKALINDLSSKYDKINISLLQLSKRNSELEMQVNKNEQYSRKTNLVFTCFEQPNDNCINIVKRIFDIMKLPNIVPEKLHYLKNEKQIIVKFRNIVDRDTVWDAKFNLKDSGFFASEDLPSNMQRQHMLLAPIARAARKTEEYKSKVQLKANVLYIEGTKYTCDKLDSLPTALTPSTLSEKKSDEVLCFGGPLSRFHPLSNFNKSFFYFKNITFSSSEQALQHQKCVYFKDFARARMILDTSEPGEQKSLGRHVVNFDQTQWSTVRDNILKDIILAKFSQNENLKTFLVETGTRQLAEASLRDTTYGIGMAITYRTVLDMNTWNGSNKLGRCLMEVRDVLKD